MKKLIETTSHLISAGRWDIDYHLPPIGIQAFPTNLLYPIGQSANVIRKTRNPEKNPDTAFQYIDIASVDVDTGVIARPQELTGEEAPSRARKVVHAYDIIISTCRPTRGAIAVVPEELHGQICSTGFSVIRAKEGYNPFYLHFALRMASTLEQFRKWSTGSSYPAILDNDVVKTLIPLPSQKAQDEIAKAVRIALFEREQTIKQANLKWKNTINNIVWDLSNPDLTVKNPQEETSIIYSIEQVQERLTILGPILEEEEEEEILAEPAPYEQISMFPSEGSNNGKNTKSGLFIKNGSNKRTSSHMLTE